MLCVKQCETHQLLPCRMMRAHDQELQATMAPGKHRTHRYLWRCERGKKSDEHGSGLERSITTSKCHVWDYFEAAWRRTLISCCMSPCLMLGVVLPFVIGTMTVLLYPYGWFFLNGKPVWNRIGSTWGYWKDDFACEGKLEAQCRCSFGFFWLLKFR